ncbi:21485_t:CDS:1 [Dentiscutata erythropus]|uniref:21485_t:CDS:1 n=1 Tax=Dentiscutata erythropus TaxID=1348616 RepID=A0A9N9P8P0_9GLOM|nr:21485_t:CDS:1 [Dentiscutata erythropus]
MSNKIFDNYFKNLDKILSINGEITNLQAKLINEFDKLKDLDSTSPEYEELCLNIETNNIILVNLLEEYTDFININTIEGDKYIEEKFNLTNNITKYLLEIKKR